MNSQKKSWALVTGATRGLGLGCAYELLKKNHNVIFAGRDESKLKAVISEAKIPAGIEAKYVVVDVADTKSLANMISKVKKEIGHVDVLINNAGIFKDEDDSRGNPQNSPMNTPPAAVLETFQVNALAPMILIQGLLPDMIQNGFGRIVNVSSGMGQLSTMQSGSAAYRISKTALNAVTCVMQNEVPAGKDVLINAVCPGWVRTDMGGAGATRELSEGVASILWAAYIPKGDANKSHRGGYFRDGKSMPW